MTERPAVPRLIELDALRGFALGGILLVNITVMSDPGGFGDGSAITVLEAFFHNKFYVLFSFLFGYSLTMQFRSAARAGVSARARTVRRCLALMVIGALHAVFFFTGDVLFGYGAIGLVLLLLSGLRPRRALQVAGAIFAVCVIVMTVLGLLASGGSSETDAAEHDRLLGIMRAGWGAAARLRWEEFSGNLPLFVVYGLINILPLFLVGLAAGKARVLEEPDRYLPYLPRIQWIGFGVGLPVSIVAALTHWPPLAGPVTVADPLLSAAYAATLLRILHARPRVADIFAPAGKIAATTYISQSIITSIIFTGYGLALAGKLSDWTVLAIAVAIYLTQLAAARIWVRHHRYGPLEWLLRKATYGPTPVTDREHGR
ncbi:DUF418 domain-containing protein [Nocardia sp. NPDC056100]|uniref:DUF418 domain-containing protein n=1 Tax=Nocardia sp. NPDC056100 TaxID=3345712 RepID=UPI0035E21344